MQKDQTAFVSVDPQFDSNDNNGKSEANQVVKPKMSNPVMSGERKNQFPKCKYLVSEIAAIETFVTNAIQSQEPQNNRTINSSKSNSAHAEAYRAILNALKRPNDPTMIWKVLLALRTAGHGSILNLLALKDNHAQLLHLIIRFVSTMPPNSFEETSVGSLDAKLQVYNDYSICDAHFNLLLAIVSAKSTHVVPILTAVWKLLTGYGSIGDEGVTNRIHLMISNVLRLVPRSNADLYPIIASRFPFWLRDKETLVWYTIQSFKVLEYLPTIRQGLFELLVDKCVEIDVNIFIEDNGNVSIDIKNKDNGDDEGENYPIAVTKNEKSNLNTSVDVLSDKLDALLELLFEQIQFGCQKCGSQLIYYEFLPIFESTILTTHKSKFVQFCMFLPCGLETQIRNNNNPGKDDLCNESKESPKTILPDQSNCEGIDNNETILYREFVSKLLKFIVDPCRATTTRQSSACYLASFVSRASFVGVDTVCESISALLRWAEAYIESLPIHAVCAADARQQSDHHSLFYTVCQAAFYIMCFRGNDAFDYYKEAVSSEEEIEKKISDSNFDETSESQYPDLESINLESKRWSSLCGHSLQPLRFCLESVRSEFLHVAHFYCLIDEVILNKLVADAKRLSTGRVNKKAASSISTAATLERRRQKGGVGGLGHGSNPLKSFFPFDPLLLRNSHEFIEPLYTYWQGPVEEVDVLVIDEIERDGDPNDVDESIDDSDGETDEEYDDEDDDSEVNHSEALSETESSDRPCDTMSPDAYHIKLLQKEAWTETMKRPRSQSMENGSW